MSGDAAAGLGGEAGRARPLTAIAAVARNGVIGAGQEIPWRIPEDWQRFKEVTLGGVLIMGRKTYESIGRPLPGRTTIVVSRGSPELPEGVLLAGSLSEALEVAEGLSGRVFIAGGGEVFKLAWPLLTDLDLTWVDQKPQGTAFFPHVDPREWAEIARIPRDGYEFVRYRRVSGK